MNASLKANPLGRKVADEIVAIREQWHTKKHPFFLTFGEGKLPLKVMGKYLALHHQFVRYALASFGVMYGRVMDNEDIRKTIAGNIAEEEGVRAIPVAGHVPHDHNELIFRFCKAAGLSDAEVKGMKMSPAWWARALHYHYTGCNEPLGVVLAMQSTQEGQQPALNSEIVLPAFHKHYGYGPGAPEIEFFTEHAAADIEHSRRQVDLAAKYIDSEAMAERAIKVAREAVMLRWASVSELYRIDVLGEKEILPPGVG